MTKCTVIQDLLPMYVSGHVSDDSRELVDEHIEMCSVCQSKLAELQNRVSAALNENSDKSVSALKSIKKRIKRKNIFIGITASLLSLIIAVSCFMCEIRIPYDANKFQISTGFAEINLAYNDMVVSAEILSIYYNRGSRYASSFRRIIERDGEMVNVVFFYLTESLSSRWMGKNENIGFNVWGTSDEELYNEDVGIVNTSFPIEIYYINKPRIRVSTKTSDEEFYAQRVKGTLIWSGTLG